MPLLRSLSKEKSANTRNPKTRNKTQPSIKITKEPFPSTNNNNTSYAKIIHGSNPIAEQLIDNSSISTTKILKIIYSLLSSIKECTDANTKDLVIKTVLSITSKFATTQDE